MTKTIKEAIFFSRGSPGDIAIVRIEGWTFRDLYKQAEAMTRVGKESCLTVEMEVGTSVEEYKKAVRESISKDESVVLIVNQDNGGN